MGKIRTPKTLLPNVLALKSILPLRSPATALPMLGLFPPSSSKTRFFFVSQSRCERSSRVL